MRKPLLEVADVHKTYRTQDGTAVHAVNGVSFSIGHAEAVGLVGASGSGKSTTAQCILQLERPERGAVVFEGADLCRLSGRALRRHRRGLQLVFQEPRSSMDPRWRVDRIVAEPLTQLGVPREEQTQRVADALAQVGLEGAERRRPDELSGGQAQRVAIARAVVGRPRLLLCDEPTSAVDVSIQAQILNLLRDLRQELELALLLISHDLGVIRAVCERVVVLRDGAVIEQGASSAVLERPAETYTQQLVAAAVREW